VGAERAGAVEGGGLAPPDRVGADGLAEAGGADGFGEERPSGVGEGAGAVGGGAQAGVGVGRLHLEGASVSAGDMDLNSPYCPSSGAPFVCSGGLVLTPSVKARGSRAPALTRWPSGSGTRPWPTGPGHLLGAPRRNAPAPPDEGAPVECFGGHVLHGHQGRGVQVSRRHRRHTSMSDTGWDVRRGIGKPSVTLNVQLCKASADSSSWGKASGFSGFTFHERTTPMGDSHTSTTGRSIRRVDTPGDDMADKRQCIRRRRLSVELKRARTAASMTIEDVAAATEWSTGKISNIETGVRLKPTVMEVRGLLDVYGVTDERHREAILDLTRQARELGWWAKFSDVFTDDFVAFEGEARSIRTYELARIPGLLQTPRY